MRGYGMEADLWSVGVILHLVVRGHLPFEGSTREEVMARTAQAKLDFNHSVWRSWTRQGRDFVARLLAKNPKERISAKDALEHPWMFVELPPLPATGTLSQPAPTKPSLAVGSPVTSGGGGGGRGGAAGGAGEGGPSAAPRFRPAAAVAATASPQAAVTRTPPMHPRSLEPASSPAAGAAGLPIAMAAVARASASTDGASGPTPAAGSTPSAVPSTTPSTSAAGGSSHASPSLAAQPAPAAAAADLPSLASTGAQGGVDIHAGASVHVHVPEPPSHTSPG